MPSRRPVRSVPRNASRSSISLIRHRWRTVTRPAVERRLQVDVSAVRRRQVVEFLHDTVHDRVPQLGTRVARVVKPDGVTQRLDFAVVEEHLSNGDVAQRRRLEHAAKVRARRQWVIRPAAQAEVNVRWIAVRRDIPVARHADRLERVVGEETHRAVQASTVVVAGEAVAFLRIVVDREASPFLRREFATGFITRIQIVAAREGVEAVILLLKRLERVERPSKRPSRVQRRCRGRRRPRIRWRAPP